MKGVVFAGDRKLQILDFPDPTPGPGEVVLEIKASGMCGSDLKFYRAVGGASSLGLGKISGPLIAGHEPCGVVAAVGPGVAENQAKVGMRVMQHHYRGCGVCEHCNTGWMQLCVEGVKEVYGATGHGAHARYMKCPGAHAGAVAGRTVVRSRRGDFVRDRHGLGRAASARPCGRPDDRDFRPGTGRPFGHAARLRDGGSRDRPRYRRGAPCAREGVRCRCPDQSRENGERGAGHPRPDARPRRPCLARCVVLPEGPRGCRQVRAHLGQGLLRRRRRHGHAGRQQRHAAPAGHDHRLVDIFYGRPGAIARVTSPTARSTSTACSPSAGSWSRPRKPTSCSTSRPRARASSCRRNDGVMAATCPVPCACAGGRTGKRVQANESKRIATDRGRHRWRQRNRPCLLPGSRRQGVESGRARHRFRGCAPGRGRDRRRPGEAGRRRRESGRGDSREDRARRRTGLRTGQLRGHPGFAGAARSNCRSRSGIGWCASTSAAHT